MIHASKTRASWEREAKAGDWPARYGVGLPAWDTLPTRAVVGVVDVIDCVPVAEIARSNPWAVGPWCWVLRNPVGFPSPLPFRGAQLLFDVPDGVVAGPIAAVT